MHIHSLHGSLKINSLQTKAFHNATLYSAFVPLYIVFRIKAKLGLKYRLYGRVRQNFV